MRYCAAVWRCQLGLFTNTHYPRVVYLLQKRHRHRMESARTRGEQKEPLFVPQTQRLVRATFWIWTSHNQNLASATRALWCIKTRGSRVSSRRCERGDRLSKGLAHPTRSHAACTSFGKLASMGAPARLSRVIMTHTFFPHQHCPRRAVDVPIGQANNQLFSACFWWQTLARPRSAAPAQSKTVGTKIRQVRTRSDSRQCIFSRSPAGVTPGAQAQVCPPTSKSQTELLCLFRPTSCDGN